MIDSEKQRTPTSSTIKNSNYSSRKQTQHSKRYNQQEFDPAFDLDHEAMKHKSNQSLDSIISHLTQDMGLE